MEHKIVVIPGDGIGGEIVEAALRVLQAAANQSNISLSLQEYYAGGAALDRYEEPLPQETVQAAKQADAVLLGAVGGPQWAGVAPELRPERAILGLRQELGLYANLRPVRVIPSLASYSPVKEEVVSGVDILIVRELNGGIYFGEKGTEGDKAWDVEMYSRPEIERIAEVAFQAAKGRHRQVTSVDKANVLASSRLWRATVMEAAKAHSDISLNHYYVDNFAMQLILAPAQFDVVVTNNLFGDMLIDAAAVLAGSIGMLPSASVGRETSLYEPIHGSAPEIAGQGIANPLGTILSAAMLLDYSLQKPEAARAVEQAVEDVLAAGYRTQDIYRPGTTKVSTAEMGRLVEEKLNELAK